MLRWFLLAFVVLALAPGTWLRDPVRGPDNSQSIELIPLDIDPQTFGAVAVEGAWELKSSNDRFGSYSGLIAIDGAQLIAGSDTGMILEMPVPGAQGLVRIDAFAGKSSYKKALVDIESLTRDPESGRIWVGYEGINSIERYDADLAESTAVSPDEMRRWSSNSGPEAMARLTDGRFVVLSEGRSEWLGDRFPGLLYPSDPVEGASPAEFMFDAPSGYRPVDMAQIPDGRVLIVLRKLNIGLPPTFGIKLALADPEAIQASIESGEAWNGEIVSTISDPDLLDNYEGLAVVPAAEGSLTLWMISDDNNAAFQRTLLLKLRFDPADYPAQ